MKRIKNICKRSLCIFLSVIILFFGVSNSYFSPHKMDTSEAACIVIGGTVCISVEFVIGFACVIGIFCLGAGIIDEMSDMDIDAVLNDVHDWLRENINILDIFGITDGSSALKTWAEADTWVVVEGTGGMEPTPDPSGSPSKMPHIDPFTLTNLAELVSAGGLAAMQYYNNIAKPTEEFTKVAKAYVDDKIKNFRSTPTAPPTDPISESLIKRYGLEGTQNGYSGIPDIGVDGKRHYIFSTESYYNGQLNSKYFYDIFLEPNVRFGGYLDGENLRFLYSVPWRLDRYAYGSNTTDVGSSSHFTYKNSIDSILKYTAYATLPIFNSLSDLQDYVSTGDDTKCINRKRNNNYIDTNDDYGWSSTANISPNDLAQAMAGLADNLTDKPVSLQGLYAAINALKAQLEDKNPNVSGNTPVPFPTVDDYKNIFESIINDPDIFPDKNPNPVPSTNPNPKPSTNPNPDDKPVTDYTGFLSIIIDLLRSILQAVKDIIALLVNWFVLDIDAIKEHLLDAISKLPNISGFDSLFDIIRRFQGAITNDYKYPVISMRTPDILKPYYNQPEIILLDFKDYATYFIWVRTILAFSICFGFALWIVKDIKIAFTLN